MKHYNSDLLKAMANERRCQIIELLESCERNVTEMEKILKISQSALSQHLAVLRKRKVVKTRREAQTIFYSLKDRRATSIIRLACNSPHY